MMDDFSMGRRGFFKLSAAVSAPFALDRFTGRFRNRDGTTDRQVSPDATVVGPVPLASPVRGLQMRRRSVNQDDLVASSGDEALDVFRSQVRAAKSAGVDALIVPVTAGEHRADAYDNFLHACEAPGKLDGEVAIIRGAADLRDAMDAGRLGLILQARGMQMIDADVAAIPRWRGAGVTIMGLTHLWKTPYGHGAFSREDRGLTPRGAQVVAALAEHGVVLDLSGVSRRTAREALDAAPGPVLFSHSNAAAIHEHPLNVDDDLIDACAAKDGVIGVSAFPVQVSGSGRPTVAQVVDHLDHIGQRVGSEHVALGLDFTDLPRRRFSSDPVPDPPYRYPAGLQGFGDLAGLRSSLEARGYGSSDLRGIFGGNLLRVLGEAWSVRGVSAHRVADRTGLVTA